MFEMQYDLVLSYRYSFDYKINDLSCERFKSYFK